MKKILTLGFGVFLMTQITAQNAGFSTAPVKSTVTKTETTTNTTVETEGSSTIEEPGTVDYLRKHGKPYVGNNDKKVVAVVTTTTSTDATTTVETSKSSNLTSIGIDLPGFEEVVKDINALMNNFATSTTQSDDKLKIKKLATKYDDMLNAELKKNKSLTETQKTDIENQIINIQTYK